ncbi:uncharacterized protein ISCGN_016366 [Ixodes scapularis]
MTTSATATNSRAIGRECVGASTQWDADEALIGQSGFRRTVLSPDRACEPRVGTGLRAPGCSPPAVRRVTCRTRQPLFAGYLAIALTVRALQQPASFHGPPALDGRHLQGSHRGPGQQPYNYWRSRQDVDVVGDFEVIDCHQEDDACCCCGAPVVTPPSAGGDNGPGRRQEHRASRVTLLTTETRRGTSTVPHGAADSSDMEASGGQGSPPNSQAEELGTTLEIEREKTLQAQILLQQLEVQLKMTELTAIRGARAGVGERDPGIERGEALKHYSKMLHGAIPKFPQEAEVPVWFETVECLFERYAVPHEIQAHLVYPLIANRLAYLCAGMKDGEFTFAHLRSVVLAELRLSADEYRKRFSTAFKKRDETWKQFSTRLASYLQYYLEARDVKDFPKLTSLLVADRMKEAMGEDAREYVILREGKEWLSPADIADLLAVYNAAKSAPRGQGAGEKRGAGAENRFHDGGRNDQKRPTGDGRPPARPSNAPLRSWRNCDMCGSPSHRAAECPRAREPKPSASGTRVQNVELRETGSDRLTLRVSKVLEEQPAPSALTHVHVMCGGQVIQALVDSGAEITVVRESLLPIEVGEPSGSVTLVSAFGQKVNAKLVTLPMWLLTELDAPTSQKVHETVSVICALTDDLAPHTDCLLALDAWEALSTSARRDTTPPGADTFGGAQSAGAVGLVKEADGATDSAESPTERENACHAETPRAEPRAPDVGPALSGAALQQPASFHGPPALDGRHLQGSHRGPGQQPYNYWRSRQDVDVVGDFEVIDCHQEDDACCCCGAPVVTPPSAGGDNGPGRRQEHRASRVTLLTTETRRGTSTVPHGAADSSDMEASGGQGSPPNSQAEELGTTLEIEREKTLQAQILLQQLEVQLKMTELTAIRGARAGVGERDPGIERGEALKHYSKMLHGAIPKFPQEAEVPVWFETVECLFERYAVPHEIQAHLVYPLIANRLAYLCAGMKDGEFTFAHLRSVVLAELRLSADEYRKRFSTAFKKRDETWKQFSTRLASYLQYYLEARDVKDFPKLTSLLVADRMKEAMGEDAREYVILREGKEWLSPADIADLLAVYNAAKSAPRGQGAGEKRGAGAENRFHDGGRNDQKRPTGDGRPPARPSNAPLRSWRNCDMCGSPSHRAAECPRAREPKPSASGTRVQNVELRETGSDRLTLRVSKVLEEQPAPSALTHVHAMCGGQVIQALVDSGAEITVVRESLLPIEVGEPSGSVTLVSAFGQKVNAKLVTLPMWLLTELDAPTSQKVHETVSVICALTDDLAPHTDCLLALDAWEALSTSARRDTTPPGADTFGGAQSAGAVGLVKEADGATDSAESPTERENACHAETPRAEPRAPDVGPALSGAGRRLELARAQGEDPTLAKAFRDAGIAKGGMFVEDGLLYHHDRIAGNRVTQLVLPRERRGDVLLLAHESPWGGHLGTRKTMARIKYSFYWPAMEADVKRHCSSCPACQLRADRRTGDRVPISPLTRPEWPFQCVNMDVIGPLDPPSARGHRYALCVVDLHTRWPEVICLRSLTAKATCEALLEIFSRTGVPERICCDQGTNFTAGLTREFLARLGCTPRFSTPDHPESNGSVERWNRVFKNMLHHVIRDEAGQWDKFVPYLLWAYREVPHETTGASPFELLYGRTPTGPLSILRDSWTGQVEALCVRVFTYLPSPPPPSHHHMGQERFSFTAEEKSAGFKMVTMEDRGLFQSLMA